MSSPCIVCGVQIPGGLSVCCNARLEHCMFADQIKSNLLVHSDPFQGSILYDTCSCSDGQLYV